jgi:kynureninase
MNYQNTLSFAKELDTQDTLAKYRNEFFIPKNKEGKELIYFCGNSLGLQPKRVKEKIDQELLDWASLGVEAHFHGKNPWFSYHHFLTKESANLVGAKESEVVVMNSLSVNLNLLMISFYRPSAKRNKILIEGGAFPSDYYAVEQQIKLHGYNPEHSLVEMLPREGEYTLRTEDILAKIKELEDELALVMFGGVNYFTGQFFDLEAITKAGHSVGAQVGFDLAHTAGNIPLKLHEWNVDFATWCSYKYLNSGPGGTSGVFVHERHGNNPNLPRLAGWWGTDEKTRFKMQKGFVPQVGAGGWQMSNAQIFPMAIHKASIELFDEAGIENLRKKSLLLTGFLEYLIEEANKENDLGFKIITPKNETERGCQLSLMTGTDGKQLFEKLTTNDVIADWREPNEAFGMGGVIRVAPTPMYNTFEEVYRFVQILKS